jgi:beta-glucan synthesis-associated protein KRE6
VPEVVLTGNDQYNDGHLSLQPGQRLSACTCEGDADQHPGPRRKGDSNRAFVGRSAPEIDIFEAQASTYEGVGVQGEVSQSAQWAPFDQKYKYNNATGNVVVADWTITRANSYSGGAYQQATSMVTKSPQNCYEHTGQCYAIYGFEYKPGFDDGVRLFLLTSRPLMLKGLHACSAVHHMGI